MGTQQTFYPGTSGDPFISDYDELAYRIFQTGEHPVMHYVRSLPFEETLYPANTYYRFTDSASKGGNFDRKGFPIDDKHRIVWSPPAHDFDRKKAKGCGFVYSPGSKGENGVINIACSNDKLHHARAKRSHCWSLSCPECCNDTALRMGSNVEEQFLTYRCLKEKQGLPFGQLGHWVISPPQEEMKGWMQSEEDFLAVRKYMGEDLCECGSFGGVSVFHPWRQKDVMWELMPHFHSLAYGWIDTDRFKRMNPGWVIKKVHAGEEIESIKHTFAYLATHMGIGLVERHPEETDWSMKFLEHMLPGLGDEKNLSKHYTDINDSKVNTNLFRWSDRDRELQLEGKGRMCGFPELDWLQWTKDQLYGRIRIHYFGELNSNNFRTVAVETETRQRVCRDCGSPLRLYEGLHDHLGEEANYQFRNKIRTFRKDYDQVSQALQQLGPEMRAQRTSIGQLAPSTAKLVCTKEITGGVQNQR